VEIIPLTKSDWVWGSGEISTSSVPASRPTIVIMNRGLTGSAIVATSGTTTSATYSNYGILGGTTISNTADKTGQWVRVGYTTLTYNSTYRYGVTANCRFLLEEYSNGVTAASLDSFFVEARITLPAVAIILFSIAQSQT
jgi:hypothetical protein